MPSVGSVPWSVSDLVRHKRTFLVATLLGWGNVFAASIGVTNLAGLSLEQPESPSHRSHHQTRPYDEAVEENRVRRRTLGVILGSVAAVGAYGNAKWWQDGFTGSFRKVDEGWFGQETYSGGADKLGHFFVGYVGTRLSTAAFQWAGNTPASSLKLAAWTTFGILAGVEVLDGYSRNWHFSKEDAIINAVGVGTGVLLEKNPALDRLIDLRLLYYPSRESGREFNPFGDYSGQTYLLVAKASGVPALRNRSLLRYLEVAVGYGTRGGADDLEANAGNLRRNVYVGLSLNVSEVLRSTVFKQESAFSRTHRFTERFLEFVQVPGTVVLGKNTLSTD